MNIEVVNTMDRGLAYAEACFETFRIIDDNIFSWPAHAARLRRGLAEFAIELNEEQLLQMRSACRKAVAGKDMLVRLTVSGGDASWGMFTAAMAPVVRIQCMPYSEPRESLSLRLLEWPSPPAARIAKFTADYATTLRALRGERQALFVRRGQILTAATANVMILRQGQWWTPQLDAGVLPGVIRQYLIDAGVVREARCPSVWLDDCTAMAVTASSFFVRDVVSIKGLPVKRRLEVCSGTLKQCLASCSGVPEDLFDA
ncbi:MAG: aminotransferase class IV [Mariprofundus sp.]